MSGVRARATPDVTAHALVRWLERVEMMDLTVYRAAVARDHTTQTDDAGLVTVLARVIDMDAVRARILTPQVLAAYRAGATSVKTKFGKLVFRNNAITSVVPNGFMFDKQKPRTRRQMDRDTEDASDQRQVKVPETAE